MIPTVEVTGAYLTALQADWDQFGDGAPPDETDPTRPWGWLTPQPRPGEQPKMGGGEPTVTVRLRVTSTAVDGDGPGARAARAQAEALDDRTKAVMLTAAMPAGTGWRVTGRWREATAHLPEPGAHTIHADYRLHVSSA